MHFSIFHMTMCMYSLKHEAQPEVFQNVFSGFWWAIPTGILSAGFVEQYGSLKNLNDYSAEADIHFVRLEVGEGHPWLNQSVSELSLPPGLLMAVIQRRGKVVVPRGDTLIQDDRR